MQITNEIISYQQVEDGYNLERDEYGIGAYTLLPTIKKTFFENPNLEDKKKCMIFFNRVDGVIGGRQMFFPTKLKIDKELISAQSGSSLQTVPKFRQFAIGMDMINYPIKSKDYQFIIYGGVSSMAKPIYKALRFNVFEIPTYWQPRSTRFLFQHIGIKGLLLSFSTCFFNIFLKSTIIFLNFIIRHKYKGYKIHKLNKVPEWVDDIILNDPHKYAELHDRKWMQWTLDNHFFDKKNNIQSFYEIRKDDHPVAFFLTNERSSELPEHNIDNVIFGTVYEWGLTNNSHLSEEDIYKIACTTFSDNVDIITISSSNLKLLKTLKWIGAIRHGNTSIIVKDLSKSYKDIGDINKWRLRAGYCDCSFY